HSIPHAYPTRRSSDLAPPTDRRNAKVPTAAPASRLVIVCPSFVTSWIAVRIRIFSLRANLFVMPPPTPITVLSDFRCLVDGSIRSEEHTSELQSRVDL